MRKVKGKERGIPVEEKRINIIRVRHVFDLGLHWFTDRAHYWPFWWCVSSRLDHIRERSWLLEVRGMGRTRHGIRGDTVIRRFFQIITWSKKGFTD